MVCFRLVRVAEVVRGLCGGWCCRNGASLLSPGPARSNLIVHRAKTPEPQNLEDHLRRLRLRHRPCHHVIAMARLLELKRHIHDRGPVTRGRCEHAGGTICVDITARAEHGVDV